MTVWELREALSKLIEDGLCDEVVYDEGDPMFSASEVYFDAKTGRVLIEFDAQEVFKCQKITI